jgi:ATP-dependent DNA ligase
MASGYPPGWLAARNGHDWADRFPAIVYAALRIKAQSFLIDGEAVITSDDGMTRCGRLIAQD